MTNPLQTKLAEIAPMLEDALAGVRRARAIGGGFETLDAVSLARVLKAAIERLGTLGQPGLDAFNELMATRGDCLDFDAGIELLEVWIGNEPGLLDQGNGPVGN